MKGTKAAKKQKQKTIFNLKDIQNNSERTLKKKETFLQHFAPAFA